MRDIEKLLNSINAFYVIPKEQRNLVASGIKPQGIDNKAYLMMRNSLNDIKVKAKEVGDGINLTGVILLVILISFMLGRKTKWK